MHELKLPYLDSKPYWLQFQWQKSIHIIQWPGVCLLFCTCIDMLLFCLLDLCLLISKDYQDTSESLKKSTPTIYSIQRKSWERVWNERTDRRLLRQTGWDRLSADAHQEKSQDCELEILSYRHNCAREFILYSISNSIIRESQRWWTGKLLYSSHSNNSFCFPDCLFSKLYCKVC